MQLTRGTSYRVPTLYFNKGAICGVSRADHYLFTEISIQCGAIPCIKYTILLYVLLYVVVHVHHQNSISKIEYSMNQYVYTSMNK